MADKDGGPPCAVRAVLQQVLSASLQVQPASDDTDAKFVEIGRGLVIYICFLRGATPDLVEKAAKNLVNVKLSYCDKRKKNVSVMDLPGDILIVPQATLGGKMKGKVMQYHSNIDKEVGKQLYDQFVAECQKLSKEMWDAENLRERPAVRFGTYGNVQVLKLDTNGPYTHLFEMT